jgi:hypothetical protein
LLILSGVVLSQLYGGFSIANKVWESVKVELRQLSSPQTLPASAGLGAAPGASGAVPIASPAALPASQVAAAPLAAASSEAVPDQATVASTALAPAALETVAKTSATVTLDVAPKEEVISTLADQLRAGHAWVLSMPTDIFLVMHSTKSSYAAASTWIKERPELDNLHIVANYTTTDTDLKYSIVSGPFDSRLEAMRFTKRADMTKGAWAIPVKLMSDRLTREPKAVAAAKARVAR